MTVGGAGGDLLDVSKLEGMFGKDLEFIGEVPNGDDLHSTT